MVKSSNELALNELKKIPSSSDPIERLLSIAEHLSTNFTWADCPPVERRSIDLLVDRRGGDVLRSATLQQLASLDGISSTLNLSAGRDGMNRSCVKAELPNPVSIYFHRHGLAIETEKFLWKVTQNSVFCHEKPEVFTSRERIGRSIHFKTKKLETPLGNALAKSKIETNHPVDNLLKKRIKARKK